MKVQIFGALAATALLAAGCQDNARQAEDARVAAAHTIQRDEQKKADIDRDALERKAELTREEARAQRDAADKEAHARVADEDRARPGLTGRAVTDHRDREALEHSEWREPAVGTARSGGVVGPSAATAELSIIGVVKDAGHDSLKVVTRNSGELAVKTDDSTRVLRNGLRVKMDAIHEGAEVRVSYRYDGKQNLADRIELEQVRR